MAESSLASIIDDARAMSLVRIRTADVRGGAPKPRCHEPVVRPLLRRARRGPCDDSRFSTRDASLLAAYVKDPTPGVTLVFEATRWDFDGDDKAKTERVRKFYGAIPDVVEFRRFTVDEARQELDRMARAAKIVLEPAAADALVEALAADVGRIAVELEKLQLYGKPITAESLPLLVPDARQSTIFALVNALGRRDRARSLDALDSLWCAKANTCRLP